MLQNAAKYYKANIQYNTQYSGMLVVKSNSFCAMNSLTNIHCIGCVVCVACVVFCSFKKLQNATNCYKILQNATKHTQYYTQQWDACCQIKLVLPNELAYKYALYRLCRLCSLCSILQLQNATNATKCYQMLQNAKKGSQHT